MKECYASYSGRDNFEHLNEVRHAFSKTLRNDYYARTKTYAARELLSELGLRDIFKLFGARLQYEQTDYSAYKLRTQRLMNFCDRILPHLARAFGEEAILKAVPPVARNELTAAMAEEHGGKGTAALIRKTF
jgi:hypothetical protein